MIYWLLLLASTSWANSGSVPLMAVKGTQAGLAVPTQELANSGRSSIVWTANRIASTATAEGLFTLVRSVAGAAGVNAVAYTITSGKTLRIDSIVLTAEAGGGTPAVARVVFRIRYATGGSCTVASPLQLIQSVSVIATAKTDTYSERSFPNGFELYGDGTKQICFSIETPDWVTVTVIPNIILSIEAFEY